MFMEFHDSESLEIASVFWEMSQEEKRHSSLLQRKYTERYGNRACRITEDDLQEFIEVPRLENGAVMEGGGSDEAAPRERALQVALQAERSAQAYYTSLINSTGDSDLRTLYTELSELEGGHVGYLERKLRPQSANYGPI
jgi:rubrerythrin